MRFSRGGAVHKRLGLHPKGLMMAKIPPDLPVDDVAERRQVAALPLRRRGRNEEVCLVTTRETRRWTIPKGWCMKGTKDSEAAAIEAEQEAGLYGRIGKRPLGSYRYWKRLTARFVLVRVAVYRLDVAGSRSSWPEKDQRQVRWMSLEEASQLVEEPGLAALIASAGKERAVA
jgi:8-oxo-dGTP pyrophosphatase MutT (NUDIX family)